MNYDLVVVGSGPGGYVAAIKAAELGLKVACVEKEKVLGGTCLNVGCIPSKALLNSSEHFHYTRHGLKKHGITTGEVKISIAQMMQRKDAVVAELNKGIEGLFKKNKIEWVNGEGSLVRGKDGLGVKIKNQKSKILNSKNVLLATGSVPIELPFLKFNGDTVISSTEALELARVPKKLLVVGAGAIGLELGSVWSRLGAEVEVVEFLPQIAAGFDPDVSKALQKLFEAQGLTFHLATEVKSAEILKSRVKLAAMQEGREKLFEADKVLVAVGRKPFTEGLGLAKAGVELTAKGRIAVDGHWQTSVEGVYAIGDVIDGPMLAHKAEAEGVAIAERLAGKPGSVNHALIPNVIYTSPECASVGRTEKQCRDEGIEFKVGKFPFQFNGRAKAVDQTDGFVKILSCKKTDRIVGASIISSNASEIIGEVVTAMEFGSSAEDLARTIHAHPTMSEVIKEAAHLAVSHG